jgi:hypothetical protein
MNDGSRPLHYALLGALALVVVSPALATPPKDGFPLSTYPMFSTNKDPKTSVDQAVAVGLDKGVTVLGPGFVGTDEVLQARATIARAVRGGGSTTKALCEEIASRVARDDALGDAIQVEIRNVTHDSIAYFAGGNREPSSVRVHARCSIVRTR